METYIQNISNNSIRKQDYLLAESYQIDEFSPTDFNDITGGVVCIVAESGAGKTVLLKDILSKIHNRYKTLHLFSRTAKLQAAYDFFPRSMITDDYDEEQMADIWNSQKKQFDKGLPMDPVLVILDDVIASKSFKKSKMIDEIAVSGRHLNITLIILSQYFVAIRPLIRENIRIAIAFAMANKKEREKFINQFLSSDTYGSGELLFKKITGEKYQSIIIQKYKSGAKINERVKKYKADPEVNVIISEPEVKLIPGNNNLVRTNKPKKKLVRINVQVDKYGI